MDNRIPNVMVSKEIAESKRKKENRKLQNVIDCQKRRDNLKAAGVKERKTPESKAESQRKVQEAIAQAEATDRNLENNL